jgi:UDP:flavonoid glycosyltransferase YjiC (YdhE family)
MVRVLIVTAGTKGDVAPAVCLAKACREQGAEAAAVATHGSYKSDVVESGSLFATSPAFFDLGPAPDEALRETPEGKELAAAGMFSKLGAAQRFMDPLITKWMDNMLAALMAFRPDVVVLFTLPIFIGSAAIEKATRGTVPVVWCHLMPFAPTAQHAPPVGFGDGATLFAWSAKLKWKASVSLGYDMIYKGAVDAKRAEWGLEPKGESPFAALEPPITVMGYSPALCPPPTDWDPAMVHVVGSLVEGQRPSTSGFTPPLELVAPLGLGRGGNSGARPVVITFGSMLGVLKPLEQTQLLSACVRAACDLSVGAIIFTKGAASDAFGGRNHALVDEPARNLLVADPTVVLFDGDCPHDWLFARAGVVVCHGGAGTVHAALSAGTPCVVSPCKPDDSDQPWWGGCVGRAGAGRLTQNASLHKTGKTLAKCLRAVLGAAGDPAEGQAVTARCKALASAMRSESSGAAHGAARLVLAEAERFREQAVREGRAKGAAKRVEAGSLERMTAAGGHRNAGGGGGGGGGGQGAAAHNAANPPPPPTGGFKLKYGAGDVR